MIRHIVAFRLSATDADQRREDAGAVVSRLEALAEVIPGTISLRVHRDLGLIESHWDLVLVSEHTTYEALEGYQVHPAHKEASAFVGTLTSDRAVVDFEA